MAICGECFRSGFWRALVTHKIVDDVLSTNESSTEDFKLKKRTSAIPSATLWDLHLRTSGLKAFRRNLNYLWTSRTAYLKIIHRKEKEVPRDIYLCSKLGNRSHILTHPDTARCAVRGWLGICRPEGWINFEAIDKLFIYSPCNKLYFGRRTIFNCHLNLPDNLLR